MRFIRIGGAPKIFYPEFSRTAGNGRGDATPTRLRPFGAAATTGSAAMARSRRRNDDSQRRCGRFGGEIEIFVVSGPPATARPRRSLGAFELLDRRLQETRRLTAGDRAM